MKITRDNKLVLFIIIQFLLAGMNFGWIIYNWNNINPIMILNIIAGAFAFYVGLALVEQYLWRYAPSEKPVTDDKP